MPLPLQSVVRQAPTDAVDPAQHVLAAERRDRVHAALAQLSDEQRAAVVLVDMEGYSVAEVALILDCAEGTVKSRCSRARARLAVLLADVLDVSEPTDPITPAGAADGNRPAVPDVGSLTRRGPPVADPPTAD